MSERVEFVGCKVRLDVQSELLALPFGMGSVLVRIICLGDLANICCVRIKQT